VTISMVISLLNFIRKK